MKLAQITTLVDLAEKLRASSTASGAPIASHELVEQTKLMLKYNSLGVALKCLIYYKNNSSQLDSLGISFADYITNLPHILNKHPLLPKSLPSGLPDISPEESTAASKFTADNVIAVLCILSRTQIAFDTSLAATGGSLDDVAEQLSEQYCTPMLKCITSFAKVSKTDATVMLNGFTGINKDILTVLNDKAPRLDLPAPDAITSGKSILISPTVPDPIVRVPVVAKATAAIPGWFETWCNHHVSTPTSIDTKSFQQGFFTFLKDKVKGEDMKVYESDPDKMIFDASVYAGTKGIRGISFR